MRAILCEANSTCIGLNKRFVVQPNSMYIDYLFLSVAHLSIGLIRQFQWDGQRSCVRSGAQVELALGGGRVALRIVRSTLQERRELCPTCLHVIFSFPLLIVRMERIRAKQEKYKQSKMQVAKPVGSSCTVNNLKPDSQEPCPGMSLHVY